MRSLPPSASRRRCAQLFCTYSALVAKEGLNAAEKDRQAALEEGDEDAEKDATAAATSGAAKRTRLEQIVRWMNGGVGGGGGGGKASVKGEGAGAGAMDNTRYPPRPARRHPPVFPAPLLPLPCRADTSGPPDTGRLTGPGAGTMATAGVTGMPQ